MTELTADAIAETFEAIIPDDTKPGPKVYQLDREKTTVVAELDEVGMGHTYLETIDEEGYPVRIDVSRICNLTEVRAEVFYTTRIRLRFIALPVKIRMLGLVEITDMESPVPDVDGLIDVERITVVALDVF